MNRIVKISSAEDIFPEYRNTPIGLLLEYHNLNKQFEEYAKAQLLIAMCMDNRKHLHMPDNFAFIIRSGGAHLLNNEFKVSFAIAIGDVKHIVIIAHNNCGMVDLISRKEQFINGLVDNGGWKKDTAEKHFNEFAPKFNIENEIDFVISEASRLRVRYPKITVAPMHYNVEDSQLYLIDEK
ncbi:MAG: carbonic anhydrase [Bacteroidota bacterium]